MELLAEHGVGQLVDVRHYPSSRRNPPCNAESLAGALRGHGIGYLWLGEELGGLRPGGFQAWMSSGQFRRGLARLELLAGFKTTAIMCAETVWVRCHRRFIAQELVARGYQVTHIMPVGKHAHDEPLSGQISLPSLSGEA